MNRLSYYSTYLSRSLAYNFSHIGICRIPGTTTAAQKEKSNSELFASLDDDAELMFGGDVEDY